MDEERAATVMQKTFRGHKERTNSKLKHAKKQIEALVLHGFEPQTHAPTSR